MLKIILACISIFLVSCGESTPVSHENQWYTGGTLHRSTLGEWKRSSYANRLASCSDFLAGASMNGHIATISSMAELRKKSEALEICISTVAVDDSLAGSAVSETASACMILMDDR